MHQKEQLEGHARDGLTLISTQIRTLTLPQTRTLILTRISKYPNHVTLSLSLTLIFTLFLRPTLQPHLGELARIEEQEQELAASKRAVKELLQAAVASREARERKEN